nr:Putative phospholipid-transporting ATPase 9 [Ipomoea batatas]
MLEPQILTEELSVCHISQKPDVDDATGKVSYEPISNKGVFVIALEDGVLNSLKELKTRGASVLCFPLITKTEGFGKEAFLKTGTGKKNIGIGDGGNDVGKLQEAELELESVGFEGMQCFIIFFVCITILPSGLNGGWEKTRDSSNWGDDVHVVVWVVKCQKGALAISPLHLNPKPLHLGGDSPMVHFPAIYGALPAEYSRRLSRVPGSPPPAPPTGRQLFWVFPPSFLF